MIEVIAALALLLIGSALIVAGIYLALGTGPALIAAGVAAVLAGHDLRRTIPNG